MYDFYWQVFQPILQISFFERQTQLPHLGALDGFNHQRFWTSESIYLDGRGSAPFFGRKVPCDLLPSELHPVGAP